VGRANVIDFISMNGLNFGGLSSSTTPLQLNLLGGASNCIIYEDDDRKNNSEEEDSLEGETYNDDGNDNTNTLVEIDPTQEDRDVLTFFRQFIPIVVDEGSNNNNVLQQPMSALQNRYNTLQHGINKQAQVKSIKSWFKDTKLGDSHAPWFTSSITIPPNDNICAMWGVKSYQFCSGQMNMTKSEKKVLNEATGGKDFLLDICGEYRVVSETNTIQFKTKKAAQKSAALNLARVYLYYFLDHVLFPQSLPRTSYAMV